MNNKKNNNNNFQANSLKPKGNTKVMHGSRNKDSLGERFPLKTSC